VVIMNMFKLKLILINQKLENNMTSQNKKLIVYAIAVYVYFGLWLYVLYPLLDNFLKGV
jgi:hypothetical protein